VKSLSQREVFCACLAAHLVGLDFERNLLAFGQTGKARPFDRADVYEHVIAAVIGLDESEALLAIEPLNCACRHIFSPKRARATHVTITRFNSILTMSLEDEPAGAFNKAQRLIEYQLCYRLLIENTTPSKRGGAAGSGRFGADGACRRHPANVSFRQHIPGAMFTGR
jgi:hypothetical protein